MCFCSLNIWGVGSSGFLEPRVLTQVRRWPLNRPSPRAGSRLGYPGYCGSAEAAGVFLTASQALGARGFATRSGQRSCCTALLSRTLYIPQALRDQVCRMPAGHPAHTGGAPRPGLRVPPALLCLRGLQAAAGHGGRVLPHGRQPAGVQGRLRNSQAARSVGGDGPHCKRGKRSVLEAGDGNWFVAGRWGDLKPQALSRLLREPE